MPDLIELIGYLASALIVISLLMSSVLRLRLVNLVGSIVFTVYGGLIGSVPVVLANGAIVLINLWHLRRLWGDRARAAYFEVVDASPRDPLVQRFVAFHTNDIRESQPGFDGLHDDHLVWLVLRDAVPVGVVLARREDGQGHLDLDYVTPAHRDFTAGTVLYGDSGVFRAAGLERVTSYGDTTQHRRYLARMGFADDGTAWHRDV